MSLFSAISPAWNIDNMRPYFTRTKTYLTDISYSNLTICLTNEDLSLDSAISAFSFAVFLNWRNDIYQKQTKVVNKDIFIALFDAERETYISRTDIYRLFTCHCITAEFLIFRDDYDFKARICHTPARVILIDHHILADHNNYMSCFVKGVVSHRPYFLSERFTLEEKPRSLIACGACATVIVTKCQALTKKLRKPAWDFFCAHRVLVDMLHTVIIDVTFNLQVQHTSLNDEQALMFLEALLKFRDANEFRTTKFNILAEAKRDLVNVTAMQMLKRDNRNVHNILVSTLPLLVKDFLNKPDTDIAVEGILRKRHCNYLLLLGNDKPYICNTARDIAVYHRNSEKAEILALYLERWASSKFMLVSEPMPCHPCFFYFKQLDGNAMRRDFMKVLEEFATVLKENVPQDLTKCIFPQVIYKEIKCPPNYHGKYVLRTLDDDKDDSKEASSSGCPPGYHWK